MTPGRREEYSDDQFIAAIRDLSGGAGTSEVAERVGCTRRTAYNRLTELEEEGRVESRKIGGALLWSLPGGD